MVGVLLGGRRGRGRGVLVGRAEKGGRVGVLPEEVEVGLELGGGGLPAGVGCGRDLMRGSSKSCGFCAEGLGHLGEFCGAEDDAFVEVEDRREHLDFMWHKGSGAGGLEGCQTGDLLFEGREHVVACDHLDEIAVSASHQTGVHVEFADGP